MDKNTIKKFKKFLESKSAYYIYIKTYRDRHLLINPSSIDEFLKSTEPKLAIPGAFVYPLSKHSIYDKDYWLTLHEQWLSYIEQFRQEEHQASILDDVDFIDVEKRLCIALGKDTASLNVRGGSRLTFNQEHTKLIAGSSMRLVALGQSRSTGDVLLMISNQRGITYTISQHYKQHVSTNVVVGSKDFCEKLSRMLGLREEYALLECKLLSKSVNMILFTLKIKRNTLNIKD